jgi:Na+-driven multidrug efflux pump
MWVGMIAGLSTAAVLMLARFQRSSRRLIALHQASN